MNNAFPYSPSADSLAGKVAGYLTLHPNRSLSLDEICDKFALRSTCLNIHAQLHKAVAYGYIVFDDTLAIYTKGATSIPSVLCAWGSGSIE